MANQDTLTPLINVYVRVLHTYTYSDKIAASLAASIELGIEVIAITFSI